MPTMVDLVCENCQKSFQRRIADVNNCRRRGFTSVSCSLACSASLRNKKVLKTEHGRALRLKSLEAGRRTQSYRAESPSSILDRFFTSVMSRMKKSAKDRKFKVEVIREHLAVIWHEQGGRCAISGRLMEIPDARRETLENIGRKRKHLSPWRASLDRIDSSIGYVPGNVQFVCTMANLAKADYDQAELVEFCKMVAVKHA